MGNKNKNTGYQGSEIGVTSLEKIQRMTKYTLIKNKIKFSSYIGKFRVDQLQSHI
jgi:hypothetical protein